MATSNSISENAISFYASGGHAHDGVTSSLIKTNSYSIYDFNPSFVGDNPERRRAQVNNYNSFRQLVVNTINSTVLEPAGIVLQDNIINSRNIISGSITATEIAANTITADNISAGAITANELAANIVLVNNYITSGNFDGTIAANGAVTSAGTVGWAVTSYGHAVFDTTFIRGSLSASEVLTPGVDIYSNGTLAANAFTLYGNGAIVAASGNFSVTAGGAMSATGASISGTINSTDGSIGAWNIDANGIYNVGVGGRSVALYPAVGSTGEAVLEVDYGGYAARVAAGIISVNAPGSSSFMSSDQLSTSQTLVVGGDIICYYVDSGGGHLYANWLRPPFPGNSGPINVAGSGFEYYATNLSGGFPIAFGYNNGSGQLEAIINNDTNVFFSLTKTFISDRRLKNDIEPISSIVLDKFYSIKTYEFDWNDKAPQYIQNTGRSVGVIADELKELYPTAVLDDEAYEGWVHRYDEHPEGFSLEEMEKFGSDYYEFVPGEGVWQKPRYASVDYTVLIPHLISAVHDLNNRVKELENGV